jgi:hypothetical protein
MFYCSTLPFKLKQCLKYLGLLPKNEEIEWLAFLIFACSLSDSVSLRLTEGNFTSGL